MTRLGSRLVSEIGRIGLASIVVIGLATAAHLYLVEPLAEREIRLDAELDRLRSKSARTDIHRTGAHPYRAQGVKSGPALEAFYAYFERKERAPDWLATLYGAAASTGIQMRAGEYRQIGQGERLERYVIRLPVSGSYAQLQRFAEAALEAIPVLSLDQMKLRRTRGGDARIEAELVFSLHGAAL
jgi:Tfp pilus assembly protein PilO